MNLRLIYSEPISNFGESINYFARFIRLCDVLWTFTCSIKYHGWRRYRRAHLAQQLFMWIWCKLHAKTPKGTAWPRGDKVKELSNLRIGMIVCCQIFLRRGGSISVRSGRSGVRDPPRAKRTALSLSLSSLSLCFSFAFYRVCPMWRVPTVGRGSRASRICCTACTCTQTYEGRAGVCEIHIHTHIHVYGD